MMTKHQKKPLLNHVSKVHILFALVFYSYCSDVVCCYCKSLCRLQHFHEIHAQTYSFCGRAPLSLAVRKRIQ